MCIQHSMQFNHNILNDILKVAFATIRSLVPVRCLLLSDLHCSSVREQQKSNSKVMSSIIIISRVFLSSCVQGPSLQPCRPNALRGTAKYCTTIYIVIIDYAQKFYLSYMIMDATFLHKLQSLEHHITCFLSFLRVRFEGREPQQKVKIGCKEKKQRKIDFTGCLSGNVRFLFCAQPQSCY